MAEQPTYLGPPAQTGQMSTRQVGFARQDVSFKAEQFAGQPAD